MKKNYEQSEDLLNKYIDCWQNKTSYRLLSHRPSSIYESNDSECEALQIFRSLNIGSFSYEDICNLSWLLTRELQTQINRDHFFFWTWVQSIAFYMNIRFDLRDPKSVFADFDWIDSFNSLVNVLLIKWNSNSSVFNDPILQNLSIQKYLIAGPLSYAVLEGLLRRKNSSYVDTTGQVINQFSIQINGKTISFDPNAKRRTSKQVNQLKYQMAILEQNTIPINRKRTCIGLDKLKIEIEKIFINTVFEDFISEGRNTLLHGNQYWQNKVPIIMNLICLMLIDEIEPSKYSNIATGFITMMDRSSHHKRDFYYPPSINI
ncbi:hypothetical protein [Candidatus Nitrosocosmicus hydrocola]|uniref:hypothetical protein n=1 Tax=Candidatus Nitrosocosmicus hydrocola TaxID=1826872 RepID=UPI0011E5D7F2|nr:hypothetical protein [Candidatus Nitrosocosmicus hydrocola]